MGLEWFPHVDNIIASGEISLDMYGRQEPKREDGFLTADEPGASCFISRYPIYPAVYGAAALIYPPFRVCPPELPTSATWNIVSDDIQSTGSLKLVGYDNSEP